MSQLAIPARYYARMGELLAHYGIDPAAVLGPAGITLQQLQRPDFCLSLAQVDILADQAVALTGRSDLGFELGRVLKLSSHSIVGFGILSSPNVGYALRLAARFFRLIMPSFRMRYRRDGGELEIRFLPTAPMSNLALKLHLEAMAVATHFELRDLLQGDMPDYALHLSFEPPAHVEHYARLREARCHFSAATSPCVRLLFPASVAERALAMADPAALKMAETRCAELVRSVVADRRVAAWTRMMLSQPTDGMPTLAELAHTLNLSARTLDRHLRDEGVSFRSLSNALRHARACELLDQTTRPITWIAHELGYTDAANFTRAFRRAAGMSPSRYRQSTSGR